MGYNVIGGGAGGGSTNPQDVHEEYANIGAFPVTGEAGVFYIALDTSLLYRWTGSTYVEVSPAGTVDLGTSSVTELNDVTSAGSGAIITAAERNAISQSTDYAPGETLYVDGTNGNDSNPGSFIRPFQTIQAAVNAATSSGYLIKVQNHTYIENLDFTNKYNITIVADGATSSQVTHINGTVNLVNAENIKFKNFYIYQTSTTPTITFGETTPVAPVAGSGRHYFENCTISNLQSGEKALSVTDGITEWIVFRSCDISGVIDMPAITSVGSSVTMLSCDNRGSSLNIGTNQTLIAVDCNALGPINHSNGVVYLKDVHAMERDGSNNSILSTAAFNAANLIYMEDVNLYDASTNTYGNINIPNTFVVLNACSRGYSNDTINEGLRIARGQRSLDIAYDNTTSGLTATNIKAALDELAASGGGASTLNELTDVNAPAPQDGQFVVYDGPSEEYRIIGIDTYNLVHTQADASDWTVASDSVVAGHLDELADRTSTLEGYDVPDTRTTIPDGAVEIPIYRFDYGEVRSFNINIGVERDSFNEAFFIKGVQTEGSYSFFIEKVGDDTGVSFTINDGGELLASATPTGINSEMIYNIQIVPVNEPNVEIGWNSFGGNNFATGRYVAFKLDPNTIWDDYLRTNENVSQPIGADVAAIEARITIGTAVSLNADFIIGFQSSVTVNNGATAQNTAYNEILAGLEVRLGTEDGLNSIYRLNGGSPVLLSAVSDGDILRIESDSSGNITYYVNGTSVGTDPSTISFPCGIGLALNRGADIQRIKLIGVEN